MKAGLVSRLALGLAALAVLAAGSLVFSDLYQRPHWGLHYEANGGWVLLVEQQSTAAAAGLRTGDTVTQIGLLPPSASAEPIDGALPVSIRRGSERLVLWMVGGGTGPPRRLLAPMLTAIALWLAGVVIGVGQPGQAGSRRGRLFALFALLAALALTCAVAQDYPARLWAQWLLAPAIFAALIAYLWLQRALFDGDQQVYGTAADRALSAQALIVLAALLLGPRLFGEGSGRGLAVLAGLDIVAMLLAIHVRTAWRLFHERTRAIKEIANIALLAGLIAWLPALLVGWLPPIAGLLGVDLSFPVSPYIGSLSLLTLAITYPLFVTWSDPARLESTLRAFAAGLVTGGTLVGLVSLLVQILDATIHLPADLRTTISIGFALVALPIFAPVSRWLQGLAEKRLGLDPQHPDAGDVAFAQGCATLTDELLLAVQIPEIVKALTALACSCLHLETSHVWLRGADRTWVLYLHKDGATIERPEDPPADLQAALGEQPIAPPSGLLSGDPALATLCVPVRIHHDLRGVLALCRKSPYDAPDTAALLNLAGQVASALQRADGVAQRFGQTAPADQVALVSLAN